MKEEKVKEEKVKEEPVKEESAKKIETVKEEERPKEDHKVIKQEKVSGEWGLDEKFLHALRILAPGTDLREGIESILRGKMGALIVVSDSPQVMSIIDGGFYLNCEFSPAAIYELAKMDGAIVLDRDSKKILWANTQMVPDPSLPSFETGIRHRTAERVARQTGELVIAISQRRGIISLYWGPMKYVLQDLGVLLVKANQALQTLEKYKTVLDKDLITLTAMEFEDLVTVFDVVKVIQRSELVMRIVYEIKSYISELGVEGRLVNLQLEELVGDMEDEVMSIIRDYSARYGDRSPKEIRDGIRRWTSEELTDLVAIGRSLGYGSTAGILDLSISPRGYRMLQKIPRLPMPVIENVVEKFNELPKILKATINELDDVEGIGEVRARAIKNGLKRLQEQAILARHS